MESEKSKRNKKPVVVVVSGGFDPIHPGHTRLFIEAKSLGDELVVILNNDNWLQKKKGTIFMPHNERKEILEALAAVDRVVISSHSPNPEDMSVCADLALLKPDIFANGGDRDVQDSKRDSSSLKPETVLCEQLGIEQIFNVGEGGKIQSSSWLLEKYTKSKDPGSKTTQG